MRRRRFSGAVVLGLGAWAMGASLERANAAGLFQDLDLETVTFYELTSGTKTLVTTRDNFASVLAKLPALGAANYDLIGSSAGEYYDIYTSDPLGNFAADGNFLTVDVRFDLYDIAGNADAVRLVWGGTEPGTDYATKITRVIHGGPPALAQTTWTDRALGAPDNLGTGLGATRQGVGSEYVEVMSITLAFPDSFFSGTVGLSVPVDSGAPVEFMPGTAGGGRLTSLNVTGAGDFSFNPSVVHGTAFGFSGLPGPPPDAELFPTNIPRQLWEIGFSGSFNGVAGLELTYDESWIPSGFDESDLVVYHYDGAGWQTIFGSVDALNNVLVFETGGFSPFVIGVIPEPAVLWVMSGGLFLLAARRALYRGRTTGFSAAARAYAARTTGFGPLEPRSNHGGPTMGSNHGVSP